MKRLRKLLALGLIASVGITGLGCALHVDGISAGLMRKSKADPEQPKPAPIIAVAPVALNAPSHGQLALAKALVCSGRFTDRELLSMAAADAAGSLILAALAECDFAPLKPPLRLDVSQ